MTEAPLQAIAEPYLSRIVSLADLNSLADRVTAAYRSAGYILARGVGELGGLLADGRQLIIIDLHGAPPRDRKIEWQCRKHNRRAKSDR